MKGPRPKTTARKRLDGNPGHRPLNDREPQPPDLSFTMVPPLLEGRVIAIAEWQRLAPMLRRCKQITEADRTALLAHCLEWESYAEAMARVRTEGATIATPTGFSRVNPNLVIARTALNACLRVWAELGLTPSSRSRVKVDGSGPGPDGDAFTEFDVMGTIPGGVHAN